MSVEQTTMGLLPTTTTPQYCEETNGMYGPLEIDSWQVNSDPPPVSTTPISGINPSKPGSGVSFADPHPQIYITLSSDTTITVIWIPTNASSGTCNVLIFQMTIVYPNGTKSSIHTSVTKPSQESATPSTSGVGPEVGSNPYVTFGPNLQLPNGTVLIISIVSTTDNHNASHVSRQTTH